MATDTPASMVSLAPHHIFALALLFVAGAASPVPPPDVTKCQNVTVNGKMIDCCPPVSGKIVDFTFPAAFYSDFRRLRVRNAAHLSGEAYFAKYNKAIELMKNLDPKDPWNFMQQANVHCAYCNGAYKQSGLDVELQVHGSWLFFPFHRAYLYFYERILGKLIGDDSFALPFWNWDAPMGMRLPDIYVNSSCSLYDSLRNDNHQPPTIADLNYDPDYEIMYKNPTRANLVTMYRQMVSTSSTASLFFGGNYSAGSPRPPGGGRIESVPHGTMHDWTGDPTQRNNENMGTLYSAGRDPIFFAHHANVDRMWEIWKGLGGKNRKNFNDTDWLDSSFIFWDENKQMVRIKVRDVLDTKKLGYTYQNVDVPWLRSKPFIRPNLTRPGTQFKYVIKFPVSLTSRVSVDVKRPRVLRSSLEKEDVEEVLVVDGIEVKKDEYAKFDVYIDAGDDQDVTPESTQFAGSFVNVPMSLESGLVDANWVRPDVITTQMRIGLTEMLDDLGVDGDSSIRVTMVPRMVNTIKASPLRVGGIRIELST